MLIQFLHVGKHESWEAVSLKGAREINFWGVGSSEDSHCCEVIRHVEEIPSGHQFSFTVATHYWIDTRAGRQVH